MAYVFVSIHIPHAKLLGAYFTLMGGRLVLVLGRFGQKMGVILEKNGVGLG